MHAGGALQRRTALCSPRETVITSESDGRAHESVWDYPRPPRLEVCDRHILVRFGERVIAETRRTLRVLETSHPPTYYLPAEQVEVDLLRRTSDRTLCEWKGWAHYYDLAIDGYRLPRVAWSYAQPSSPYEALAGAIAFYAHDLECFVDGEFVTPQPGGFYGGWITSEISGLD